MILKIRKILRNMGIDFVYASEVFSEVHFTKIDSRKDYGERRWITMGSLYGRVLVIAHTYRGNINRIISMRKANEREKKIYQEQIKKYFKTLG